MRHGVCNSRADVRSKRSGYAGRTAIVTGGGSGIGAALGRALAERGALVTLADIDGDRVEAAATAAGASVEARIVDVRDSDAVAALVSAVVEKHGRIDYMFNNAGLVFGGQTDKMPLAYWDRIIDVNVRGVVHGVLAAYPVMAGQGSGHIVNTASLAGLVPSVMTAAYTMTKHAVVGLSSALRPEAARAGVAVSVLCPGAVDTAILDDPPATDLPEQGDPRLTGRQFMEVIRQKPMSADRFAEAALRGVGRNRAVVIVPASARPVWYLNRLAPGLVSRVSKTVAGRVIARQERERSNM